MPSRIIVLDGSGSLSFDVMAWLAEQKAAKQDKVVDGGEGGIRTSLKRLVFSTPIGLEHVPANLTHLRCHPRA
jgi:hypothetical protein